MSEFDKLLSLGQFPLFQHATQEEAALWVANTTMRIFQPGEYLLEEGKPVETIHFITRGEVRLLLDQKETMVLEGISTIGVFAAMAQSPTGQGALALQETHSVELPVTLLTALLEDNFSHLRRILSGLFGMVAEGRKKLGDGAGFPTKLADQPKFIPAKLGAVDRLIALNSMMAFSGTSIDAVAKMATDLTEVRYNYGHILWEQGDPGDFLICIIGGVLKCSSEKQVFHLGPKDFAGSLDAWTAGNRGFKVEVVEDLVALQLPVQTMIDTFEDHFKLASEVMKNMAAVVLEFQRQSAVEF